MTYELSVKSLEGMTDLFQSIEKEGALRRLIASDRSIEHMADREVMNRLVLVGFANHFNAFKSVVEQYFVDVAKRRHAQTSTVTAEIVDGVDRVVDIAKPMSYKLFANRCFSTNPVRHLDELPYRLFLKLASERHGFSNEEVGQLVETILSSREYENRQVYDIEESGLRRRYKLIRLVASGGIAEDQTVRLELLRSEFEGLVTRLDSKPKRKNWSTAERIRLSNAHCRFANISNCYVKIASLFTFGFAMCRSPEVLRSTWKYMMKTLTIEDHENIALGWNPTEFDMEDRVRHFERFGIVVPFAAQSVLREIIDLERAELPSLTITSQLDPKPVGYPLEPTVHDDFDICESESEPMDSRVNSGLCDVTYREIHRVHDTLGAMEVQMKRIMGAVKSIQMPKREYPVDIVKMEGVREDWIVKRRRILHQNRAEWIESDLQDDKLELIEKVYTNNQTLDHYPFEYGEAEIHLDSVNFHAVPSENTILQADGVDPQFVGITPPSTIQKGGHRVDIPPERERLGVEVQRLYDDVFGSTDPLVSTVENIPLRSNSSPVEFNDESRSRIISRMRVKFGINEFFGGMARKNMFNSKARPLLHEWDEFLERCLTEGILEFRECKKRKIYRFRN